MQQTIVSNRTFFEKDNDIRCRGWAHRFLRFVRAQIKNFCFSGQLFADDPRVIVAWKMRWDPVHYLHFLRWRDEGFRPETVYDIGAHQGVWAEMCQNVFEPKALILFEPQRELQEMIKARQARSGFAWTLVPLALGDKENSGVMYLTENRAASSLLEPVDVAEFTSSQTKLVASEQVNIMPLDRVVATRAFPIPDLVKIDVQGFEGTVLSGGRETIAKAKRLIVEVSLNEIYEQQPLLPEVLSSLTSMGFVLDDISETLRPWPGGRLWQVDLWLRRKQ